MDNRLVNHKISVVGDNVNKNPSLKKYSKRGYRLQAEQHHAPSATSSILLIHPVTESAARTPLARKEGKKGKAGRLQAWSSPEGSRKLRFPDFMQTAQDGGKVVSLTHRLPLPPRNTPGTHFC